METTVVEPEPVVVMESSAERFVAMDSSDEPPTKKRKPSSSNFIWDVKNFSKLNTRRHYSNIFVLDGYEWRILIFPKGDGREYLSIFLYVVDAGILPYGWTRDTQFTLSVISQENDKYTVKREKSYVFDGQKDDCGHKYFMPLAEVNDPSKGFLVNDTLKIEVEIVVSNDLKPETAYICDVLYYDVLSIPTVGSKDSEAQHSRTSSCAVCWNAPKQGVCIPCGHMSSCMSCMQAVQRKDFGCPICRAKIQKVVRVYVI
ncbi:ubiquitinyl hydrolase 1 [Ranunculus cassubicifolius]